jgi:hypothetical protein
LADSSGKERKGKAAWHGGICGGAGPGEAEEGKKKGGRRGKADRWDRLVSETRKKKKRRQRLWAAAGEILVGRWAVRPEGEKVSFLFFLFSNSFQTKLLNLNSNQTFSNFSQNFIIFLKVTEATKNHAKPNNDAQPLVVSILINLSLIF